MKEYIKKLNFATKICDSKYFLVAELENNEKIIEYQIKTIQYNKFSFIPELSVSYLNNKIFLNYDITNLISLNDFLNNINHSSNQLKFKTAFEILKKIFEIFIKTHNTLLYTSNILIDNNHVYISNDISIIKVIYIPVKDIENEFNYILAKNLIETIKSLSSFFSINMNSFNYNDIYQYLINSINNCEKNISFKTIYNHLESLEKQITNQENKNQYNLSFKDKPNTINTPYSFCNDCNNSSLLFEEIDIDYKNQLSYFSNKKIKNKTKLNKNSLEENKLLKLLKIPIICLINISILISYFFLLNIKITEKLSTDETTFTIFYILLIIIINFQLFKLSNPVVFPKPTSESNDNNNNNNNDNYNDYNDYNDYLNNYINTNNNYESEQFYQSSINDLFEKNNLEQFYNNYNQTCILQNYFNKPKAYLIFLDELEKMETEENLNYKKVYINKTDFSIGKLEIKTDYVINNKYISRLHAKIIFREGNYFICDMHSKNGTFVNGFQIPYDKEFLIKNEDIISFANIKYKFHIE